MIVLMIGIVIGIVIFSNLFYTKIIKQNINLKYSFLIYKIIYI